MCANWLRTRSSMRSMPDPDCRGITVVKVSFGRYTRSARRTSIGPIKKKVRRDARTKTSHGHGHGHRHVHGPRGFRSAVREVFSPHSHDAADSVDDALESSAIGIRAVKISLVALGVTAVTQVAIVAISGSVALLADTIHNFSDALTAVHSGLPSRSVGALRPGAIPMVSGVRRIWPDCSCSP